MASVPGSLWATLSKFVNAHSLGVALPFSNSQHSTLRRYLTGKVAELAAPAPMQGNQ